MMGVEGGVAWVAIVLMAAVAEGDPDPKPVLANYFGIPASQYPAEVYRYDPRANDYGRYTQNAALQGSPLSNQGGRYFLATPYQGGYVTQEYAVEEPHVTGRYDHDGRGGYVNPPTVTVRPLQYNNNRGYSTVPVDYQHRQSNGVVTSPYYDSSYNGVVRRAGIGEDGRDFQGASGTYTIRGGVFPAAEYEQADYRDGYYRAPSGDFNAYYRGNEPNYYNYDNSRSFGYNPQIQNRGESGNPNLDREAYDSNSYDGRKEGYGAQQSERNVYSGNQTQRKVPVRGINSKEPQVFYPAKRNDQAQEGRRYN